MHTQDGVSTENLLRIYNAELTRDCAAYAERRCQGKRPGYPSGRTDEAGAAAVDSGYSPGSATDNSTETSDGSTTHIDDGVHESSASTADDSNAHEADASSSDRTHRHAAIDDMTSGDPDPSSFTVSPDLSIVPTYEAETFPAPEPSGCPSPRLSASPLGESSLTPHTKSLLSEPASRSYKCLEPAQLSKRGEGRLSPGGPDSVPLSRPPTTSSLKRPLGTIDTGEETHASAKAARTVWSGSRSRLDVGPALALTFFFRPYQETSWRDGIAEPSTLAIERSLRLLDARPRSQLHESTSTSGIDRASITWRGACAVLGLDPAGVWEDVPAPRPADDNADNDGDYDDAASDFVEWSLVLAMNELLRRLRASASRWTVLLWADLAAKVEEGTGVGPAT